MLTNNSGVLFAPVYFFKEIGLDGRVGIMFHTITTAFL